MLRLCSTLSERQNHVFHALGAPKQQGTKRCTGTLTLEARVRQHGHTFYIYKSPVATEEL